MPYHGLAGLADRRLDYGSFTVASVIVRYASLIDEHGREPVAGITAVAVLRIDHHAHAITVDLGRADGRPVTLRTVQILDLCALRVLRASYQRPLSACHAALYA